MGGIYTEKIPSPATISRMLRYYRYLTCLSIEKISKISSQELAKALDLGASQVRQDLNILGCGGHQGYGYSVNQLIEEISLICGFSKHRTAILVGAGYLGRTVASTVNFDELGFHLLAVFDKKESVIGQIVHGLPVRPVDHIDDYCREYKPQAAVLCLPFEDAPIIARQLSRLGVKAIWNIGPFELPEIQDVIIQNDDLAKGLMQLSYKLKIENK